MPFGKNMAGMGNIITLPGGTTTAAQLPNSPIAPANLPAGALNPNGFPSPAAIPIQTGVIVPGTGSSGGTMNWLTSLLNTPTAQIAARNLTSNVAQQQQAQLQSMMPFLLIGGGLLLLMMAGKHR
jgi:hypothetical protein